jgi:hypothetical protein
MKKKVAQIQLLCSLSLNFIFAVANICIVFSGQAEKETQNVLY